MPTGLLLHGMAGQNTLSRQTLNSDRMELEKFARLGGAYKRFEGRGRSCPWTLHRAPTASSSSREGFGRRLTST